MRRIDLVCKMVAPLYVALLTAVFSTVTAVIIIAAYNLFALILEWFFIYYVYVRVPELAHPKCLGEEQVTESANPSWVSRWFYDLKIYYHHPTFLGGSIYTIKIDNILL